VLAQLLGASGAAAVPRGLFGTAGHLGATLPEPGFTSGQAFGMEVLLTFGLVSVILGVPSAAQNVGQFAAIGVGSYIVLAGLWSSPVSGASKRPRRPRPRSSLRTTTDFSILAASRQNCRDAMKIDRHHGVQIEQNQPSRRPCSILAASACWS